jgi:Secretion system C-terminal sorting domain
VHHIAYHTSWPGTDAMYNNNSTFITARTTFYSVSGVPNVVMGGNLKQAGPSAFSQTDISNENSKGSPLKIDISQKDDSTTRTYTIVVSTVGVLPIGSFNLVAAVVERVRDYTIAPGTNGEKHFPNVFLDMLTTGANGQAITLAPQGQSVTNTFTINKNSAVYTTLTNPSVNMNNLAVVAFVQNNTNKYIAQSAATYDKTVNCLLYLPTKKVVNVASGATNTFNFKVGSQSVSDEDYTYTLTASGAPADWTSNFTINNQAYTTKADVTVPSNTNYDATINITPGATPGVSKYTLTVTSKTNPTAPPVTLTVYVISGVTDLVVNSTSGFGAAAITGTASKFESQFLDGLRFAGKTSIAATDAFVLENAIAEGAMDNVKNIYLNIGWTFPAFTEGLVDQLTAFLNVPGKGMFVCGQDVAWDVNDVTQKTPAKIISFFAKYINATYLNDGVATNTQLTANAADNIFGTIGNHTISTTVPYTDTYFFPDEIAAGPNGKAIFTYNGSAKVGGVRSTSGTYKVVFLGVGIEQLASAASKNAILKLSHDWFYGLISSVQFDKEMSGLSMGQNYPNPFSTITNIPVTHIENDMDLQVIDLVGRVIITQKVEKGATNVQLNNENLQPGSYFYRLIDNNKVLSCNPMQVIR